MLSATLISPWLGGWRNVFFLYAAISALFGLPWYLSRTAPRSQPAAEEKAARKSFWTGIKSLSRIRDLWLLGFAVLGVSGSVQGLLGYLPLYLRGIGWQVASADGALAAFHVISMAFVLPVAMWSDRNGSRTKFLLGSAALNVIGLVMLSQPGLVSPWIAVLVSGMVRDAFMAIFLAMVIETKGVSPADSGIAIGFVMIFLGIGNLAAPPLGNNLASISPGAPFLFWAALAFLGLGCITLIRDRQLAPRRSAAGKKITDENAAG
jgi:cyanate permease